MANIHYSKTYVSSTERGFDASFIGAGTRTPIRHYLGGYEREYLGYYNKQYEGSYTNQYGKIWSNVFEGVYTKLYVGNYIAQYTGAYTGTFEGSFDQQFAKIWTKQYTKAYAKTYEGTYSKQFTGYYTGQYSKIWTNDNTYDTDYTGYYTGYFARDGIGIYTKIWSTQYAGNRTYYGQYTNQFDREYVGQYEGSFVNYYSKTYTPHFLKQYTKTYTGSFNTYTQTNDQFDQAWSGVYAGFRNHGFVGARYFQYDNTETYTGGTWIGNTTGYFTGPAQTLYWIGPRRYYVNFYPYILYDYEPRAWAGVYTSFYGNWIGSYTGNFVGASDSYSRNYAGPGGSGWIGSYALYYEGVDVSYEDFGPIYFPVNYSGTNWIGSYQADGTNYTKQYIGNRTAYGTFTSDWTGQYTGYYTGTYAGDRYWIGGPFYYDRNVNYQKEYAGPGYSKAYSRIWTGNRDHGFNKQYEGSFAGNRTYYGQYTNHWDAIYIQHWVSTFEGVYTGAQFYGGNTTGASFHAVYEGVYAKNYEKQYTGTYVGYYEKQYDGHYNAQYTGTFIGNREHTFTRVRGVEYLGYYEKAYTGYYGASYGAQYEKVWTGQYTKTYVGNWIKNFGGSYAGDTNTGTSYSGTTNYTKSYAGALTFDQVFATTTSAANTKTGELTSEGISRVKSSGAWKQAKDVFIKKNDAWSESKAVYVKEGDTWKLVHIGWERTDIQINADTKNFNLFNTLIGLSKSPASRPQLVNIYVNDGYDIYSTSSVPAVNLADSLGTINLGSNSIKHLVRIFVHPNARIIGAAGHPGSQVASTRTGNSATNGYDAIKTSAAVELYIENYGIIAGGGGGGGSGGYPVEGSSISQVGGAGGYGAGYASISNTDTNILENNSLINGTNSIANLGIHGGSGGLLGQRGTGAGGYNHPDGNVANPGTLNSQYDQSGNGGTPGAAISGYDATRTTFINTGRIWGDSKYKII